MSTSKYLGHTITRTSTTTKRWNGRIAHVYAIEGPHGKPAGRRPFLISREECRDFVRDAIHAASTDGRAEWARISAEMNAP